MTALYQFMPWVRQGAASVYDNPDGLQPVLSRPDGSPLTRFPVNLRVNDTNPARVQLRLYGPGDVTGLDPRVVIRTDPPALSADFEPNYLASIEFDLPELPWLFTPARAGQRGRLRPWLCLVVLEQGEEVTLRSFRDLPLPLLTAPVDQLPNLAESWAWAHAQVIRAEASETAEQVLASRPDQNLSRLVCPRRLRPNTAYLACLVPAFEAGRKAGLGFEVKPEDEDRLAPAWDGSQGQVQLPVYYHWEFRTGVDGDFEDLAIRLEGRPVPEGVGRRPISVSKLPFGLPDLGTLQIEGALGSPDATPQQVIPAAFRNQLRSLLNLSAKEPVVTPPIYGRWQASQSAVPAANGQPIWLRELNLDPRLRAAAGLGVQVVQEQQEALMASAWEQLGDAPRVAQLERRLDLTRAILQAVTRKRLGPLPPAALIQFLGPAQARVRASPETLKARLAREGLAPTFSSAPLRRLLRPSGPLARRVVGLPTAPLPGEPAPRATLRLERVAKRLGTRPPAIEPPPGTRGLVSPLLVNRQARVFTDVSNLSPAQRRYLLAVKDVQTFVDRFEGPRPAPAPVFQINKALKKDLLAKLDPPRTARLRFFARLSSNGAAVQPPADEDQVLLSGPSFPQPMYLALRDLSPEFLLPGAADIPPDTVTLVKTNTRFIEAYMAGLNHEMGSELLWREFPNDQRQTYFRSFWDARGAAQPFEQLPPIHTWESDSSLGEHFSSGDEQLVLLVRGQLLLRYPDTLIYAAKAETPMTLGSQRKLPLFRGRIDPDMVFLGFDLTPEEVRGGGSELGWFFVLQEQPTAPRFGLDETRLKPLDTWNDLAWSDIGTELGAHLEFEAVSPSVSDPRELVWAFNAAHVAGILRQRPVMVAIHASRILTPAS